MSLRDLPYLKLYVQDFLTDEKLIECSAAAQGVYIRIMCIMHKSEHYGKILLKQKDKQKDKQIENFALKLAKQLPYGLPVILAALEELISEQVLHIEGDFLVQKRMAKDGELSVTRSEAGASGGKSTQKKNKENKNFAKANTQASAQANTQADCEYEYNNKEGISKEVSNKEEGLEVKIESKEALQKKEFNRKPLSTDLSEYPNFKKDELIQFFKIAKCVDITYEQIEAYWYAFKTQHLTGENFYNSESKVYQHFFNWVTQKDLSNGKQINYTSTATDKRKISKDDAYSKFLEP